MSDGLEIPSRAQRLAIASAPSGTHDQWYARIKMKTDPAYNAVIRELASSDLPLLDIGCGMGLLGLYLRAAGFQSPVTGIDFDATKIAQGQTMIQRLGHQDLSLATGNALSDLPSFSGNVVILDILQYFNADDRHQVLRSAMSRVAPSGKLIIRSGLKDASWRFRLTVLTDAIAASAKWMKSPPLTYPTQPDFESVLSSEGFESTVHPLWGRTPFNNYLIVGSKPPQAVES